MHIACGDQVEMQRRSFLKTGVTAGGLAALGVSTKPLLAHIPPHNFDRYDFGSGPAVSERLYQGAFSADDYPSWNVVMALTPSREIVPNYGMGLITYVCDEVGPAKKEGATLAESYDGHAGVEYVDTFMYGFWGEGHTWPLESNPFPDNVTAENTFLAMLQYQTERWRKTPMLTNTQPDFSKVGNSELVDRTIRSFNWLRTDTIFIENEQIEALSNRPPWTGASVEVGISDGSPQR